MGVAYFYLNISAILRRLNILIAVFSYFHQEH
jgi:hypothetical protein